jgi:hypothetical protein
MHLAAAGLSLREVDLNPESAQECDCRLASSGVHRVVKTSHEQRHLHGSTRKESLGAVNSGRCTEIIGLPIYGRAKLLDRP